MNVVCGSRALTFAPDLLAAGDIRAWLRARQDTGVSNSTLNRALTSLRSYLAWCVVQGTIAASPVAQITALPTPEVAPRGLSPEGLRWLVQAADAQDDARQRRRDRADHPARRGRVALG